MAEQQRWTAKRKSEVILQILRQTTTIIDVARQNDLIQCPPLRSDHI
jgi:transposase-like protein